MPNNNTYESVPIPLSLNKDDPILKEKQKLLGFDKLDIRTIQCFPFHDYMNSTNEKILSYLRFIEYAGEPHKLSAVLELYLIM